MTENTTPQYTPGGSPAGTYNTPPLPLPEHMKRKKQPWFKKPIVLIPAAAMLVGLGMGAATTPDPVTVEVPGPERIVEKRVEVKVPVTPAACIEALDLAQQGFTYSSESMGYMNDAVQAAGRLNVAGLEQANADLEKVNPKLQALTAPMQAATAECRASAK